MYLELHEKSDIDLYGEQHTVLMGMLSKDFARYIERMWAERRSLLYGVEMEPNGNG